MQPLPASKPEGPQSPFPGTAPPAAALFRLGLGRTRSSASDQKQASRLRRVAKTSIQASKPAPSAGPTPMSTPAPHPSGAALPAPQAPPAAPPRPPTSSTPYKDALLARSVARSSVAMSDDGSSRPHASLGPRAPPPPPPPRPAPSAAAPPLALGSLLSSSSSSLSGPGPTPSPTLPFSKWVQEARQFKQSPFDKPPGNVQQPFKSGASPVKQYFGGVSWGSLSVFGLGKLWLAKKGEKRPRGKVSLGRGRGFRQLSRQALHKAQSQSQPSASGGYRVPQATNVSSPGPRSSTSLAAPTPSQPLQPVALSTLAATSNLPPFTARVERTWGGFQHLSRATDSGPSGLVIKPPFGGVSWGALPAPGLAQLRLGEGTGAVAKGLCGAAAAEAKEEDPGCPILDLSDDVLRQVLRRCCRGGLRESLKLSEVCQDFRRLLVTDPDPGSLGPLKINFSKSALQVALVRDSALEPSPGTVPVTPVQLQAPTSVPPVAPRPSLVVSVPVGPCATLPEIASLFQGGARAHRFSSVQFGSLGYFDGDGAAPQNPKKEKGQKCPNGISHTLAACSAGLRSSSVPFSGPTVLFPRLTLHDAPAVHVLLQRLRCFSDQAVSGAATATPATPAAPPAKCSVSIGQLDLLAHERCRFPSDAASVWEEALLVLGELSALKSLTRIERLAVGRVPNLSYAVALSGLASLSRLDVGAPWHWGKNKRHEGPGSDPARDRGMVLTQVSGLSSLSCLAWSSRVATSDACSGLATLSSLERLELANVAPAAWDGLRTVLLSLTSLTRLQVGITDEESPSLMDSPLSSLGPLFLPPSVLELSLWLRVPTTRTSLQLGRSFEYLTALPHLTIFLRNGPGSSRTEHDGRTAPLEVGLSRGLQSLTHLELEAWGLPGGATIRIQGFPSGLRETRRGSHSVLYKAAAKAVGRAGRA